MYGYCKVICTQQFPQKNATLNFIFRTNNKCTWYLDDASVKTSTQVELLTNGHFDQSSILVGWVSGASATCASSYGVSATKTVSGNYSFYHGCSKETARVSQAFNTVGGQVYNISYSYYLTCSGSNSTPDPVDMNVSIA